MKKKHEEILNAIKRFCMKNGYAPSVRQIGNMVGLKSTSSVYRYLEQMEARGLIRRDPHSPRAICIPGFRYGGDPGADYSLLYVLGGEVRMNAQVKMTLYEVSNDVEYLKSKMREKMKELLEKIDAGILYDCPEKDDMSIAEWYMDLGCNDHIHLTITPCKAHIAAGRDEKA